LHTGKWVFVGPISYFFSDDGTTAGLSGLLTDHVRPAVVYDVPLQEGKKILAGQIGRLPLDVTLGGALKIEGMKKSWLQHIKAGGIVIIPILLLGIFCIVCFVWKFLVLRRLIIPGQEIINKLVELAQGGQKKEAFRIAMSLGAPFGPVLKEGVEHIDTEKEHLEEIMHERILFQIPYLEKGLSLLAVGAAASPLLGLLGTVTGMMHTFNLVTIFGTGKADLLSSGISEALITTEYGLIVAIPALLAHAFLSRRVKVIIHMLEQKSLAYVNVFFRKKRTKENQR
jgi:biopolymer transport protein ExbB